MPRGRVEVPLPELPPTASVAAQVLYASLSDTRTRRLRLPSGEAYSGEYAALARIELQQLKQLESMLPPEPPDPEHDPTNIAARSLILHQARTTIEAVKERARRRGFRFPGDP